MGENAGGVRCRENDYSERSVVTHKVKVKGHCALPQAIQNCFGTKWIKQDLLKLYFTVPIIGLGIETFICHKSVKTMLNFKDQS